MDRTEVAEHKSFKQRSRGIMKKSNDLRKMSRKVQIAVFILRDKKWSSFRSEPDFPPGTEKIGGVSKLPADFTTQREAEQESRGQSEILLDDPLQDCMSRPNLPITSQSLPKGPATQSSQSYVHASDPSAGLGEDQMMSFDTEYYDTMPNEFQEIFTFPAKTFAPFIKSDIEEAPNVLQSAPSYEKGSLCNSSLPYPPAKSRKSLRLLRGPTAYSPPQNLAKS